MINQDLQLKLQAYLDGELSATESAEAKALLAREPVAQALLEELRGTNAVLAGYETECKLPESREFFWSKIERQIEREDRAPASTPVIRQSWFAWLQRHFLPVGGVALMIGLGLFLGKSSSAKTPGQFGEMELASDDMGAYTFRDQQQQMTMVWLYDRSHDDSQFTQTSSLANVDPE